MNTLIIVTIFTVVFVACAVEQSEIKYGKDACSFCKMNIVDRQHAAEIVTNKGKAFKYDAIECMVREIKELDESEISLFLITDFSKPGELVDATEAIYLVSENLPSPMGANLSGFLEREKALAIQKEKDGTLYTWSELKELF